MAIFRMRVFRYTAGDSDKVWAIGRDGARVLVFYGKYTQSKLNGGPVKLKTRDPYDEVTRRVREQLDQGYQELGEFDVDDRHILWKAPKATEPAAATGFGPTAFVTLDSTKVEAVVAALAPFGLAQHEDRLEVTLPNGEVITWRYLRKTFAAKEQHGAYGRLAVLAAAVAAGLPAFDADNVERSAAWLRECPELFADIPNLRELAADLRLMAPALRVKAAAERPSLF
jgi:hypothetical protein